VVGVVAVGRCGGQGGGAGQQPRCRSSLCYRAGAERARLRRRNERRQAMTSGVATIMSANQHQRIDTVTSYQSSRLWRIQQNVTQRGQDRRHVTGDPAQTPPEGAPPPASRCPNERIIYAQNQQPLRRGANAAAVPVRSGRCAWDAAVIESAAACSNEDPSCRTPSACRMRDARAPGGEARRNKSSRSQRCGASRQSAAPSLPGAPRLSPAAIVAPYQARRQKHVCASQPAACCSSLPSRW